MRRFSLRSSNLVSLAGALACALGLSAAQAQAPAKDIAGAKDHPLVSRFAGASMKNFFSDSYAEIPIPAGPGKIIDQKVAFEEGKSILFTGKRDGYIHTARKDKSPLEIFRNHQAALEQGGFSTLYTGELQACGNTGIVNTYGSHAGSQVLLIAQSQALQTGQVTVNAEALIKDYKIDGKRLAVRGVASLSPVMSNAGDDGRGKNRRVEMVKQ
jgi:hypothetical protein